MQVCLNNIILMSFSVQVNRVELDVQRVLNHHRVAFKIFVVSLETFNPSATNFHPGTYVLLITKGLLFACSLHLALCR